MRYIITLLMTIFIVLGCSGSNTSTPPLPELVDEVRESQSNRWTWGFWEFAFNNDHTQVEVIQPRGCQYHFCVTKLMETYPCTNCLTLGKPSIQPDGTVKLNVTLSHPFPLAPKYTGFDVRGMVYFPPTFVWETNGYMRYFSNIYNEAGGYDVLPHPYTSAMPLIFSRADQGGGELLNADGYSVYLIPGVIYSQDWPIYSYSSPKYSNEPAPFSTINPYKLFASNNDRRMFLVSDIITREFHFALPPGPFKFGYAVDASWCPPINTPVTNPSVDFPREANAEDPWLIEFEQLLPFSVENVGKDIFKVTAHHRGISPYWDAYIWVWDLSTDCPPVNGSDPQFKLYVNQQVDEFTNFGYSKGKSQYWWDDCGGGIIPGHHLGLLIVYHNSDMPIELKTELEYVFGPRFVDIYVE